MPELPDVELFRRIFEEHGLGRAVAAVAVLDARILEDLAPERFIAELSGDRFLATRRHGKHLLVSRARGGFLGMHFGLTGALAWYREQMPPYARVVLHFPEPPSLAYVNVRMLGGVGLIDDLEAYIAARGLGPDALDPALDAETFAARLGSSRRAIKAVLMEQSVVAGIGNIYADEILFQAGLRPDVPVSALDERWRWRLFAVMRKVLATAVHCGAGAERGSERLPADWLTRVRGKEARCPRCSTSLASLKMGGRSAYFCPRCQIDPRPREGVR